MHFKAILVDTHNDILTTAIDDKVSFDQALKGKPIRIWLVLRRVA
ncbi:hypothetical protein [Paraflavitalea speifideaquila]|nr:hypothetical protein [Paraflavitalea speifideiaquila]